jgi:ubiquinone/menaquinone biosynthesis C-methylase UbiE
MTRHTPAASGGTSERHQQRVDRYFTSESQAWKKLYEEQTVYGAIHQGRQAWALTEVDELKLPSDAQVLEVGCGAGLTSAALAQRGLRVTAIDSSAEMVELTRQLARDRNLEDRISVSVADAQELPFADESFSMVIALGVLPWLHEPDRALAEMARLVPPGGYVLTNVDNILRMHFLLDPRLNPAFRVLRRGLGRVLRRLGVMRSPAPLPSHLRASWSFDASVSRVGLEKVVGVTHGFGPFTFMTRPVFSEPEGVRLHHRMQVAADDGSPLLRPFGAQYFVLARKPNDTHQGRQREAPPA